MSDTTQMSVAIYITLETFGDAKELPSLFALLQMALKSEVDYGSYVSVSGELESGEGFDGLIEADLQVLKNGEVVLECSPDVPDETDSVYVPEQFVSNRVQ